jgi:polyisoprenoid-binding protein YceI
MALRPGRHEVGPDAGRMQVQTYREGLAQKVGHDLILDVELWSATLDVDADGRPGAIALEADPRSLQVREGRHGVKPLTDKDRAQIRKEIEGKVLGGQPIAFQSDAVQISDDGLLVSGRLTLAGATRPASFAVALTPEGRLGATLSVTQSDWGIKPYRAFMGALKVRDAVEVVLDVGLPAD